MDADSTAIVGYFLILISGAAIGSFLNVVIHRLPLMMFKEWFEQCAELKEDSIVSKIPDGKISLAYPASNCPACSHKISPWHNIPIVSYILLKAKCSHCGARISPRYFFVEVGSALVCVFLYHRYGLSLDLAFVLGLTFLLIPLIFIDVQYKLLPDTITYILLWMGVIYSLTGNSIPLEDSVIGVLGGYLSLWTVYILFKIATGKEGMGHGDFKLLGALGAWVGWQYLLHIILISSVMGTLFYILVLIINNKKIDMLPFGPFLATAGWITFMWGNEITVLYSEITGLNLSTL